MSINIAVKVSEGIVLATDSRFTVVRAREQSLPELMFADSSSKVWALGAPNSKVAVSFYGTATTALRSVGELVQEYAGSQGSAKPVKEIAEDLHRLMKDSGVMHCSMVVAGYDGSAHFGRLFLVSNPGQVQELFAHSSKGIQVGGQSDVAEALLKTLKPPLEQMGLPHARSLAAWLIETSIKAQEYSLGLSALGGAVQVATLERRQRAVVERM